MVLWPLHRFHYHRLRRLDPALFGRALNELGVLVSGFATLAFTSDVDRTRRAGNGTSRAVPKLTVRSRTVLEPTDGET